MFCWNSPGGRDCHEGPLAAVWRLWSVGSKLSKVRVQCGEPLKIAFTNPAFAGDPSCAFELAVCFYPDKAREPTSFPRLTFAILDSRAAWQIHQPR